MNRAAGIGAILFSGLKEREAQKENLMKTNSETNVKTYGEMNSLIVGLLQARSGEVDLYAAARIEELERALEPFARVADLWDELADGPYPAYSSVDIIPLAMDPYRSARRAIERRNR